MKKLMLVSVGLAAAAAGAALVTEDVDGGQALVVSGTAFSADERTALNDNAVKELWKTGPSTLAADDISGFTGVIRVKGGIYRATAQAGLGTTAGATYVEDGATLELAAGWRCEEPLHLAGRGTTSSNGALLGSVGTMTTVNLTLEDDALVTATGGGWYLYNTLNMNGHTLSYGGPKQLSYFCTTIANPGHFVVDGGSTFWMTQNAKFNQGPEHTIVVTNNSQFSGWQNHTDGNWKLIMSTTRNAGLYGTAYNASTPYRWCGPVETLAGFTTYCNSAGDSRLTGPLSGPGNYWFTGCPWRLEGTNTFSGTLTAGRNSTLTLADEWAAPDMRPEKVIWSDGGTFMIPLRPDDAAENERGWSGAGLTNVLAQWRGKTETLGFQFSVPSGRTATVDVPLEDSAGYAHEMMLKGGGTLAFAAPMPAIAWPLFSASEGTVVKVTSADADRVSEVGECRVRAGTTVFEHAGTLDFGTKSTSVYGTASERPVLKVTDGTTFKTDKYGYLYLGNDPTYCSGGLLVEGGVVTNNLYMGGQSTSVSYAYQRGGEFYNTGTGGYDSYISSKGYGYYELSGGWMGVAGWTRIAHQPGAKGAFYMKGGTLFVKSTSLIGAVNGTGVVYQTGGKITTTANSAANPLSLCLADYAANRSRGGLGNLTVRGPDTLTAIEAGLFSLGDISNSVSCVNLLDGGTFKAPHVTSPVWSTHAGKRFELDGAGNVGYLNFDGGVLKPNAYTTSLYGGELLGTETDDRWRLPTRVTVYAGGATVDTDGRDVSVSAPFQKPEGQGVVRLALPDGAISGYVGAPVVSIVGDGQGATAVAEFDSLSGAVTNVTVTSSGLNYGTATARLVGGGHDAVDLVVTLGDNVTTGGFTKAGAGTLTLKAANTYGGDTVLAGGTLKLGVDNAIPSGSTVVCAGGALDLNGKTLGAGALQAWKVDVAGALANGATTLDAAAIPSGATLTVTNAGALPDWETSKSQVLLTLTGDVPAGFAAPTVVGALPEGWRIAWVGRTLKAIAGRGTLVILR